MVTWSDNAARRCTTLRDAAPRDCMWFRNKWGQFSLLAHAPLVSLLIGNITVMPEIIPSCLRCHRMPEMPEMSPSCLRYHRHSLVYSAKKNRHSVAVEMSLESPFDKANKKPQGVKRDSSESESCVDRFLVANKRLYIRVCPSVGPSVRPCVRPSFRRSVTRFFKPRNSSQKAI